MCCADVEKAFNRVPKKVVELAMRKKEIQEVKAEMSLYKKATFKTK